jgi:hypothetical protein
MTLQDFTEHEIASAGVVRTLVYAMSATLTAWHIKRKYNRYKAFMHFQKMERMRTFQTQNRK